MSKILVTGANGFIGKALVEHLTTNRYSVRAMIRSPSRCSHEVECVVTDLSDDGGLRAACADVSCVIHLAGRAHVLKERITSPLEAFRQVNVAGTLALIQAAARSGVSRFVFVSSIGVNGDRTDGQPFSEHSPPSPCTDYARSKYEAEQALISCCEQAGIEWVIVRPPMVVDSDAPGNFARLLKLVDHGVPMPFGQDCNQRSLVSLRNLVSFLEQCAEHPLAAGEVFLAADGDDVSTREIISNLAHGMGRPARLLSAPVRIIGLTCRALGRQRLFNQLYGSLQVDAGKAQRVLGWAPRESTRQALVRIGHDYSVRF
jgi:nucleoside-diphosphate-sugar epimerase